MQKRICLIIILLSFLPLILRAQVKNELILVTSAGTSHIPVYERRGIVYFSVNHFADATSASYYVNNEGIL